MNKRIKARHEALAAAVHDGDGAAGRELIRLSRARDRAKTTKQAAAATKKWMRQQDYIRKIDYMQQGLDIHAARLRRGGGWRSDEQILGEVVEAVDEQTIL